MILNTMGKGAQNNTNDLLNIFKKFRFRRFKCIYFLLSKFLKFFSKKTLTRSFFNFYNLIYLFFELILFDIFFIFIEILNLK